MYELRLHAGLGLLMGWVFHSGCQWHPWAPMTEAPDRALEEGRMYSSFLMGEVRRMSPGIVVQGPSHALKLCGGIFLLPGWSLNLKRCLPGRVQAGQVNLVLLLLN